MNKILVTGSTGFIGRSLVSNLLKNRKKVYAIIRKSEKNIKFATKTKKQFRNYLPIFFSKNSELRNKISNIKPHILVNLATNYLPNPSDKEIHSVIDSNIVFPTLILDICCKSRVSKIINICSTMQCHKNQIDNPQNFYALTKILFKKTMSYYQKIYSKKIFLNLYIGDTYGSNDTRKKILPIIVKNYKSNKKTSILTKNLKLNILHIEDIITGLKILINDVKKSSDYFVKSEKPLDLFNVIKNYNSTKKRKVKLFWLNKKVPAIISIKMKTIPGWSQKFNVINYFYKDLNESI
tara:strand:- start:577 stop:1458 length:882 start_codon:yes stop_codon:yes gene_type:complete